MIPCDPISWRRCPERRNALLPLLLILLGTPFLPAAAPVRPVATAMNQFGLELQRQIAGPNANVCLSPYSIETAFAMTYAGSAGRTRREMASVFHFPTNESELHEGLATLQRMLDEAVQRGEPRINTLPTGWNPGDPLTLSVANRLFGRNGVRIQAPFLSLTRDRYGAPLETLDFLHHTEASRLQINAWVAEQTRQKILDLIPSGNLPANTELVLVNALYFRAQWANPFQSGETHPEPFRRPGLDPIPVPMMTQENQFGYVHRDGYTMLTLPYSGRELQLVVLLPTP
ncbi:MAG: serpin family protein [Verrucomicrobiota bacterium]